jgi:hypothetical protein
VADLTAAQIQAILDALTPSQRAEAERLRDEHNARVDGVYARRLSVTAWWNLYRRWGPSGPLRQAMMRALERHRLHSEDADLVEPGSTDLDLAAIEAPNRPPTSAELVRAEHADRVATGRHLRSIGDEGRALSAWLQREHHAKLTPRYIENLIRADHPAT